MDEIGSHRLSQTSFMNKLRLSNSSLTMCRMEEVECSSTVRCGLCLSSRLRDLAPVALNKFQLSCTLDIQTPVRIQG